MTDSTTDFKGPILLMVRGVPGSGKSYIAAALQHHIGADRVELLDPDSVDTDSADYQAFSQALTADGIEEKFHAYRYVRDKAYKAIDAGKLLVWNQPFTNLDGFKLTIQRLNEYADEHGIDLPLLVAEVEVDAQTAHDRVVARKQAGGHGPDDERFALFVSEYHSFADDGYDVVTVHGSDDVEASVATITAAIAKLR